MKKILSHILIIAFLTTIPLTFANAVDCEPTFNRNYTVEGNCTWPTWGYKVFGDIIVATRIVTIPTGVVMGIDLATKKITFTTGKILLTGTAKIDNSVSTRYYKSTPFTSGANSINVTPCSTLGAWYEVLNRHNATVPFNYQGSTIRWIAQQSGTMHCGK